MPQLPGLFVVLPGLSRVLLGLFLAWYFLIHPGYFRVHPDYFQVHMNTSGPFESLLIKTIKLGVLYNQFPKICGWTYVHMEKNVTFKDSLRINARNLKTLIK